MTRSARSQPDFSGRARAGAFAAAGRGLVGLLATQAHAWVHGAATVAVVALAVWLELPSGEWRWLVLAIALVWVTEALNTALEMLADAIHPEYHAGVGRAKDTAAAAVLLASVGAAAIGGLVLGPPLWERIAG